VARYVAWFGIQPRPPRTGVVYVLIRVVVSIIALALMVLVYGTKQRALFIAPPIGVIGGLSTWYLLGDTEVQSRRRLLLAAGVGLVLAELTWAFGYWNVPALVGGVGLWLSFYVLSGIVEHGANLSLDRRIGTEYGVVGLIGAAIILIAARPWSG
jgi:uncharacterized protein DUF5656